jgi:hypothetical protein
MNTKQTEVTGEGNAPREIRAATHAAVQPYIEALATACAQRDELLAIIKALLDAHTPYMIRKASAEARLAIAKAEDWPLIETRAFQLKAGAK